MADETVSERVQVLVRLDRDTHDWLLREKQTSGRSLAWMIENAVTQWRQRIEKGRKSD
jgi:hypothetical protein